MKDWGSKSWFGEGGEAVTREKAGWVYGYLCTVSAVFIGIASQFDVLVKYFYYNTSAKKLKNARIFVYHSHFIRLEYSQTIHPHSLQLLLTSAVMFGPT